MAYRKDKAFLGAQEWTQWPTQKNSDVIRSLCADHVSPGSSRLTREELDVAQETPLTLDIKDVGTFSIVYAL